MTNAQSYSYSYSYSCSCACADPAAIQPAISESGETAPSPLRGEVWDGGSATCSARYPCLPSDHDRSSSSPVGAGSLLPGVREKRGAAVAW